MHSASVSAEAREFRLDKSILGQGVVVHLFKTIKKKVGGPFGEEERQERNRKCVGVGIRDRRRQACQS